MMITKKKYLLLSLYFFFSVFSLSQTIDPNLISQLSPEQIEAAQEVLETKNISEGPESQDSIKIDETLVKKRKNNDEQNPKKFGYDFFFINAYLAFGCW